MAENPLPKFGEHVEECFLKEHEQKITALRQALAEGESSGCSTPLDMKEVIARAKRVVGIDS